MPIPEPEKEEGKYSDRILLRVPIYLHKELSELAKKEDISLNQLLNHLIERGLASLRYEAKSVILTKTNPHPNPTKSEAGNIRSHLYK